MGGRRRSTFQEDAQAARGHALVNRIGRLADSTQAYVLTEKIDLTRARDFHAQEATEDLLVASIDLPLLGKRGVGNDTGMAVASFKYTDIEGQEHNVIAICAYTISGMVNKTRAVTRVIIIPLA